MQYASYYEEDHIITEELQRAVLSAINYNRRENSDLTLDLYRFYLKICHRLLSRLITERPHEKFK